MKQHLEQLWAEIYPTAGPCRRWTRTASVSGSMPPWRPSPQKGEPL